MSSNPTSSSVLLNKLSKVPLLCDVLEKQMHEESQKSSISQPRYFAPQDYNNSVGRHNIYGHEGTMQRRRHSLSNWERSHTSTVTTSGTYQHGSSRVYRPLNTPTLENRMSRHSFDNLYPLEKLMESDTSNNYHSPHTWKNPDKTGQQNPPKSSIISHLDLESNYMGQDHEQREISNKDNYPQHHFLGDHTHTEYTPNSDFTNITSSRLLRERDKERLSRRASTPTYPPNKHKHEWELEDVFVGRNEREMNEVNKDGKHGLKRRHYSETPQVESSSNYKKMRRTSGPEMIRPQVHQNLWTRERRSPSPHPVELPFTLDTLTDEIKEISKSNAQSPDLLKKKETLKSVLENIFKPYFPGCSLHLVGSSVNGFGNQSSDADFCLMLTQWREIDQRREARRILLLLNQHLQCRDFVKDSQVIFATVPIIKFEDTVSKCECDININNHVGIRNTFLLKAYCEVDKRLCPLVMVIKKWAKAHGINEAKDGTLSSYALTLMTIHYLQYGCKPPVLPSLQKLFPDLFSEDGNVINLLKIDIQEFFQENAIPGTQNFQSLGELLLGFFRYFATNFSWSTSVMSVRLGRAYGTELGILPRNKYIYIEEPFDSNNVAKTVYNYENFNKIKMKISLAANKLQVSPSLKSIL